MRLTSFSETGFSGSIETTDASETMNEENFN
jgi:hypothetical protein